MTKAMSMVGEDAGHRGPSRAEIETLCILHVIGAQGCSGSELTANLGLAPGLAPAVVESVAPLVAIGWVEVHDDRFAVTEKGQQKLADRLSVLLRCGTMRAP